MREELLKLNSDELHVYTSRHCLYNIDTPTPPHLKSSAFVNKEPFLVGMVMREELLKLNSDELHVYTSRHCLFNIDTPTPPHPTSSAFVNADVVYTQRLNNWQ